MMRFATAAAVALLGLAAFAPPADAQVVIGTRPAYAPVVTPYGVVNPGAVTTGVVTAGYYSPYPGYVYSPFVTNNYIGGYGYGYPAYYGGYSGGYGYRPRYGYPMGGRYHRW